MRIWKRTCLSAPEQREKRIKTNQCITSQNTASTSFLATEDDIQACSYILSKFVNLPSNTWTSAMEALRDGTEAIFFINLSNNYRLKWLKKITPVEFRNEFVQWRKGGEGEGDGRERGKRGKEKEKEKRERRMS